MKFNSFTTFVTYCLSVTTLVSCVTPSYNEEAALVERDLNVPSFVADLLDGFDVAEFISDIDFDKIAGWADDLLNKDDNIKILDNILGGLKNSHILPEAAVYIVTHNTTLGILKKSLPTVLSVAGSVNTTALFVALDRSGLAYSVVAGSLTDKDLLPSVLSIAKKLIKSGGINFQDLLKQAGELVSRDVPEYERFDPVEPFEVLEKRDNIEDLLTTVFSSVERSGLVNDTVHTLLTDEKFQDATVVLIQGALQNIGSIISGTNFSALKPILNSLVESGLLSNTLERALDDEDLRKALTSDLAGMLKKGTIKESDLVVKEDKNSILSMDSTMEDMSGMDHMTMSDMTHDMSDMSEMPMSTSSGSDSSETTDAEDIAGTFNINKALAIGFVPLGLMLL